MQPALAFPYHDPDGTLLPHVQAILPDLRTHFAHAYVSAPPSSFELLQQNNLILADSFFTVIPVAEDALIGEAFAQLYQRAAELAPDTQLLHLCYPDRVAFALEGTYREAFLADVAALSADDVPLIFQRSQLAWETHPQNYHELEGIVTTVAQNLFGKALDYGWCHIVVRAAQLREIMPLVKNPDLSMVAEMIYYLQDHIHTRDVDWLAWEDPFIFKRDSAELKREREHSLVETNKRLKYILPMLATLTRLSMTQRK